MMKNKININTASGLRKVVTAILPIFIAVCLLLYPKNTAQGIRNGLTLLGTDLIPSLFPFMVLSTYISHSSLSQAAAQFLGKPARFLFKTGGNGIIAFILGALGGYPVGAKTVSELYTQGKITLNETERLFYWCINPAPAFVITAVGVFMLGSFSSGVILYCSCILASLTMGILCRFLSDGKKTQFENTSESKKPQKNIFVKSVSEGTEAMLAVCGWVLTFSAISSICEIFGKERTEVLFLKSVLEVTTGCKTAASNGFGVPVIAGIIGFGGFAVLFQVAAYADICGIQIKRLLCSRLINAAFSSLFASVLIKLFPQSQAVSVNLGGTSTSLLLYHSVPATVILLIMCAVFILEVDNRKKVC